ncbi:MAG TPA: hypothetical protein V6D00_03035 [Pantanalinema sp.]
MSEQETKDTAPAADEGVIPDEALEEVAGGIFAIDAKRRNKLRLP